MPNWNDLNLTVSASKGDAVVVCRSENQMRIAVMGILYNPPADVLGNIVSYLDQVAALYVVDNSDEPSNWLVERIQGDGKVHYLCKRGNLGVATALNCGAEMALTDGFEFLLTMDQDSRVLPGMVEALMACHGEEFGLVAPYLLTRDRQIPPVNKMCRPVLTAMTSGSLLSLEAYQKVGPFRDDFFIDFVDIEYCLRLQRHGYKILQADGAHLEHHVGRRVGKGWFSVTTHPPLRKYYKTRNRFQVWKEYGADFPGYVWGDRLRFVLEFGRLLLFEPEKRAKLHMMWRGYRDYRAGRFGKYQD